MFANSKIGQRAEFCICLTGNLVWFIPTRTKLGLHFDRWLLVESSRCNVAGKHHMLLLNIWNLMLGLFTLSSAAFAGFYFIFMGHRNVSVCTNRVKSELDLFWWGLVFKNLSVLKPGRCLPDLQSGSVHSSTASAANTVVGPFLGVFCVLLCGEIHICTCSPTWFGLVLQLCTLFAGTESHQPLSVAHPSRTTVSVISFRLTLSFVRS